MNGFSTRHTVKLQLVRADNFAIVGTGGVCRGCLAWIGLNIPISFQLLITVEFA